MFSKPKNYKDSSLKENMERDKCPFTDNSPELLSIEKSTLKLIPEDINFMLVRETVLTTPGDVYLWFNNLSSNHQKTMMKGFVDCLKMNNKTITAWEQNSYEENIPMEVCNNDEKSKNDSLILPCIVRDNVSNCLLNTNEGHPNVTERKKNEFGPILEQTHFTGNLLKRQSSDGLDNYNRDEESNMEIE